MVILELQHKICVDFRQNKKQDISGNFCSQEKILKMNLDF